MQEFDAPPTPAADTPDEADERLARAVAAAYRTGREDGAQEEREVWDRPAVPARGPDRRHLEPADLVACVARALVLGRWEPAIGGDDVETVAELAARMLAAFGVEHRPAAVLAADLQVPCGHVDPGGDVCGAHVTVSADPAGRVVATCAHGHATAAGAAR